MTANVVFGELGPSSFTLFTLTTLGNLFVDHPTCLPSSVEQQLFNGGSCVSFILCLRCLTLRMVSQASGNKSITCVL